MSEIWWQDIVDAYEDLVRQINTTNRLICRQLDEDIAWFEERKNIYAQVAENLEVIMQKANAQRKGKKK